MDKNECERLRALCEKATPPPWRTSMTGYSIKSGPEDPRIIAECPGGTKADTEAFERWIDNAEFIVSARTALPALLDELDRIEQERDCYCEGPFVHDKDCFKKLRECALAAVAMQKAAK